MDEFHPVFEDEDQNRFLERIGMGDSPQNTPTSSTSSYAASGARLYRE